MSRGSSRSSTCAAARRPPRSRIGWVSRSRAGTTPRDASRREDVPRAGRPRRAHPRAGRDRLGQPVARAGRRGRARGGRVRRRMGERERAGGADARGDRGPSERRGPRARVRRRPRAPALRPPRPGHQGGGGRPRAARRGRPPPRARRVRHEGRRRGGAGRVPRGGGPRAARRRDRRGGRGRGALEPGRARGARVGHRRRGDRDRADRARADRRAQGLRVGRGRGDRPRRARFAPAPRRRRDREGRAGARRARRARRGARRAHAPAARARLGPRLDDPRWRGAVELPGALRGRPRAPHAAGRDGRGRRGRARRPARPLPRRRPGARGDGAHAARPRAVRGLAGRRDRRGGAWRRGRGARRTAAARGRVVLGGRRVHRRRGHPDRDVRARGGGGARGRGVGEHLLDRAGRALARRDRRAGVRVSGLVNPAADPRAVPAPSDEARAFHASLPGYAPTPLRDLPAVAAEVVVAAVALKDESHRLRLPGVKVLGGSWGGEGAPRGRGDGGDTLLTASAGNHGRAVAHVAAMRGLRCRVFLPERAAVARREAIAREGAEVVVVDAAYEEAVARARAAAAEPGVLEIADVGHGGPAHWGVDGYATLFAEAAEQGDHDVVVVPVGVGSLAAAAVRFAARAGARVVGVEPETAACLTASLRAGRPVAVDTPGTTMAGLDCAEVSAGAWPDLRAGIRGTVTVADGEVAGAVRELAGAGLRIGECGAAPLVALRRLASEPRCAALRDAAGLGPDTRVLLVATEGPTDPASYARAVG